MVTKIFQDFSIPASSNFAANFHELKWLQLWVFVVIPSCFSGNFSLGRLWYDKGQKPFKNSFGYIRRADDSSPHRHSQFLSCRWNVKTASRWFGMPQTIVEEEAERTGCCSFFGCLFGFLDSLLSFCFSTTRKKANEKSSNKQRRRTRKTKQKRPKMFGFLSPSSRKEKKVSSAIPRLGMRLNCNIGFAFRGSQTKECWPRRKTRISFDFAFLLSFRLVVKFKNFQPVSCRGLSLVAHFWFIFFGEPPRYAKTSSREIN